MSRAAPRIGCENMMVVGDIVVMIEVVGVRMWDVSFSSAMIALY